MDRQAYVRDLVWVRCLVGFVGSSRHFARYLSAILAEFRFAIWLVRNDDVIASPALVEVKIK